MLLAKSAIQWGTLPDWVAAISTALAFAIALLLLWLTLRDRRKQRRAERRAQADLVAAWPTGVHKEESADVVTIDTRNASNLPVYGVQPTVYTKPLPKKWPPNDWMISAGFSTGFNILGPGETREARLGTKLDPELIGAPHVQLTFTDAAGVHWRRNPTGELVELSMNMYDWSAARGDRPTFHWWQWRKRRLPGM